MAQRKTLNETQISVLRWIADGCPDGVMEGESHRISAAALRARGLVTTSGRGPTWEASITNAGREHLDLLDGPNSPVPRQANVSVTQQLVDDVVNAGGSLRVPRKQWYDREAVDYENRARLAEIYGKVPSGKRLVVTVASPEELLIELVDASGYLGGRVDLLPVGVPERIARYHAAAREFRDLTDRHEVSRELLARATRIVHAIAAEAERREWSVRTSPDSKNGYGRTDWTGTKDGHLQITAQGHDFSLRLQEEGVHTRGQWEEEVRRYRNVSPDWYSRPVPSGPYDAGASGRLKLELQGSRRWIHARRQSRWADRQSWTLEERLPHLFREMEERIAEAERKAEEARITAEKAAEAARREAEERERRWHVLMAEAEKRLAEDDRAKHLRTQAAAWHETETLRRYCDALDAAHGESSDTAEWLRWIRAHIIRLDPLTEPPTMPDPREATPEALEPFLPEGWSPYGPHDQRARRVTAPQFRPS